MHQSIIIAGIVAAGALLTAPQAEALEQPASTEEKQKTRVVVLGSGWAAFSFLKALRPLHSEQQ